MSADSSGASQRTLCRCAFCTFTSGFHHESTIEPFVRYICANGPGIQYYATELPNVVLVSSLSSLFSSNKSELTAAFCFG